MRVITGLKYKYGKWQRGSCGGANSNTRRVVVSEKIVSPGVLAIENDQSFVTQQPVQAGAAIIGPTVKGKVGIPTIVTSYSDYLNKFGATFLSGSIERARKVCRITYLFESS